MIKKVQTDKAPAAIGPYSQAIIANGMIYLSGQIPVDPETNEIAGQEIHSQSLQVFENIFSILEYANSSVDRIVKTTCYLADMKLFDDFNKIYEKYIDSKPARSCVAVKSLPKNVLVEVEIIALIDE